MYKKSLFERKQNINNFGMIRSKKHQLYFLELQKKSLCPGDDKRWICSDGINTLAHGHHQTMEEEME